MLGHDVVLPGKLLVLYNQGWVFNNDVACGTLPHFTASWGVRSFDIGEMIIRSEGSCPWTPGACIPLFVILPVKNRPQAGEKHGIVPDHSSFVLRTA